MTVIGKKMSITGLTIVMLAGGILAGCSSDEKKGNAGGDKKETVTLKMIESLTSPERTTLLKNMLGEFEKQNPTIKVELISPPLQNADTKIAAMLGAKESLDVLEVRDNTAKQFVTNKFIEDLKPFTTKWENYKTLNDSAKMAAEYIDDKPYYIPYGLYQKVLYYRQDWFKEKGLTPPKTWQEVYEKGKALTDPAKNRYGYAYRGGAGGDNFSLMIMQAFVGDKINPNDSMFLKDGQTIFSSPEAKQAMELFTKIYQEASPKDSTNWAFAETVESFVSGVTAMLINDPEVISVTKEKMAEGTWATAPIPLGPSGKAPRFVGAAGWGMTSYTKHKEEAWKLIEFLSSPEQNLKFAKGIGLIPIHTSAQDDEFFKVGAYQAFINMNNNSKDYFMMRDATNYQGNGQFKKLQVENNQTMILGSMQLDKVLEQWDAYWKNEKATQKK
ncbi:extracellular solute-binding protein [Paenibacillus sp. LMG 31460]|uniref:Extracellular solute-binding protein n=1 Tax=Paenibacillus germinis TaxID=2654979 RepID=A0ABX1Z9L9_9BACL|nr:sugar ABC transporter substrate-binding protein [Paenibacillus germinis]NOU89064.1 extracellular solute-binding protein [Paenibacillus germinis]